LAAESFATGPAAGEYRAAVRSTRWRESRRGPVGPTAVGLVLVLDLLTACSSSVAGAPTTAPSSRDVSTGSTGSTGSSQPGPSSGAARSSGSRSATAPPPSTALTPAALAERLRAAAAGEHSAHVTVAASGLAGRADEQLSGGRVSALHVVQDSGSGITYEVLVVGRHAWVRLPAFYATHSPWVIVSTRSPVAPAQGVARSLPGVLAVAAPGSAATYVAAAVTLRVLGRRVVGGVPTVAYDVTAAAQRLPAGSPLRTQLTAAGSRTVRLAVDADATDRVVRLAGLTGAGFSVTWTAIDQPVRIVAPPAAEIGRD